jgi:tRNA nucleotidyltransferase/poly(A) polymerase
MIEDSLQVLGRIKFISRLGLVMDLETIEICKSFNPLNLSEERIFYEFVQILMSKYVSNGIDTLKVIGWMQYFPEMDTIEKLKELSFPRDLSVSLAVCFSSPELTIKFLTRMKVNSDLLKVVPVLVSLQYTQESIRRLSHRLSHRLELAGTNIETFYLAHPKIKNILNKSRIMKVNLRGPIPRIKSKDVLKNGIKPGPLVGQLLRKYFEDQLKHG